MSNVRTLILYWRWANNSLFGVELAFNKRFSNVRQGRVIFNGPYDNAIRDLCLFGLIIGPDVEKVFFTFTHGCNVEDSSVQCSTFFWSRYTQGNGMYEGLANIFIVRRQTTFLSFNLELQDPRRPFNSRSEVE
jgi:hypothetical protein